MSEVFVRGLRFMGGVMAGGLGAIIAFVALGLAAPLISGGGPPSAFESASQAHADGRDGKVRVTRGWNSRVQQRCRGECDEVRL